MSKPRIVDNIIRAGRGPFDLLSGTPHEITNSWTLLGNRIDARNVDLLGFWMNLDINSSTSIQIQAVVYLNADDTAVTEGFYLPIRDVSASSVGVQAELLSVTNDADIRMVFEFDTDNIIPFVEFYVKDAADGTGQIDEAYLTFRKS